MCANVNRVTSFGSGCTFFQYSILPIIGFIGAVGILYAIYTIYAISITTVLASTSFSRLETNINILTDTVYDAFENFSKYHDFE